MVFLRNGNFPVNFKKFFGKIESQFWPDDQENRHFKADWGPKMNEWRKGVKLKNNMLILRSHQTIFKFLQFLYFK